MDVCKRAMRIKRSILIIGVLALLIHHHFFFYGYFGFDDMHYAKLSNNLLQGNIDFSDHYSYRWMILSLTALAYKIFGINDFASALPSLVLTSGSLYLIYRFFKGHSIAVFLLSNILFFSVRWNLFYSDKLMPDIFLGFFVLGAWVAYMNREQNKILASVFFVLALFFGFLSKGTIILFAPILLYYLIVDFGKKDFTFWKYAIGLGVITLSTYLGILGILTGDIFARFSAINSNEYFNECSYHLMPFDATIDRLTLGFTKLIYREGMLLFLIIGLLPKLGILLQQKASKNKKLQFHSNTIILWFLSMNFMTISLSAYNPTCLDIRHYLLSVPILCICSASIIQHYIQDQKKSVQRIVICLSTLLLIPSIEHAFVSKSLHFNAIKKEIKVIANNKEYTSEKPIVSNQVLVNFLRYYSGFRKNDAFLSNKEIRRTSIPDSFYIASNWFSEYQSNIKVKDICPDLNLKFEAITIDQELNKDLKWIAFYKLD